MRLPKDFQIDAREVKILPGEGEVAPRYVPGSHAAAFDLLAAMPDDFMAEGRQDAPPQAREGL
jgi:antitoxin VapB